MTKKKKKKSARPTHRTRSGNNSAREGQPTKPKPTQAKRATTAKERAAAMEARKRREDQQLRERIALAVSMRIQGRSWEEIAPAIERKNSDRARHIRTEHPKLWDAEEAKQMRDHRGVLQQESLLVLRQLLRGQYPGQKKEQKALPKLERTRLAEAAAVALLKHARECIRIELAAKAKTLDVKLRAEKGLVRELVEGAAQELIVILREEIKDEGTIDRIAARLQGLISGPAGERPSADLARDLFSLG